MKRLIFGIIILSYALFGVTMSILTRTNGEVTTPLMVALIVLVPIACVGILMIYSGKKYLKFRNQIVAAANQLLDNTAKIDVGEISKQLGISDTKIKTILNEGLRKDLIPIKAKISYPGNGDILCNIPYARAESRGWDIVLTDKNIYFISVYKMYWLHSLIYFLTTPLYLLPLVGQLIDVINTLIFLAIFRHKTKINQKLELEDRLRTSPASYSLSISDIKTVKLGRKKIEFATQDKLMKFYLVKKLNKVSPQFGDYMKELKIQVI